MNLWLLTITTQRLTGPAGLMLDEYVGRSGRYLHSVHKNFLTEGQLVGFVEAAQGRARPVLLLMDRQGKLLSSEQFSEVIGFYQSSGTQQLMVAIGPADGWSEAILVRADRVISFGKITLPHQLAAIVAAEQMYRALTILAGHPYHKGH